MKILIIGATSGMGRALAEFYAEKNQVIATGRRADLLGELASCHRNITTVTMDITHEAETTKKLRQLWESMQQIDVAVVCAGVGELNPDLYHPVNAQTIQTNVVGWTNLVDHIYLEFQKQGFGHLVTVTSLNALRGEPVAPAYSASKAFQCNYTEALCKKSAKMKVPIHVTDIRPGLVQTAMAKGEGLFWVMPVDKVARQIMVAIARKSRIAIVTKRWKLAAFLFKHMPWWLYKRL